MTALGANVSVVPQSLVYGETLEDYTLDVDYNIPLAYRATQTPALGDSYPDDTAPWDYIVVETGSYTTGRRPDSGAFHTHVRYAKVKTPYTSGIDGLREAFRKFETGRLGRYMGTRVFLAADADAEAIVEASLPETTPMVPDGAWAAALLRDKAIERRWRVGLAKITAVYDTWTEREQFEVIGKGILEADAAAVQMWNNFKVDEKGNTVGVPFTEGSVRKCWVLIKGSNAWPHVTAQLRIKVLLNTSRLNALAPLVGRVNSDPCLNILGAPAHTLWFNKLGMRQRQRGLGRLYDTIVYLKFDPAGWDAVSEAQLQEYRVSDVKVYEEDGTTDTENKQRTWTWIDKGQTVSLIGWKEASLSIINGYLG